MRSNRGYEKREENESETLMTIYRGGGGKRKGKGKRGEGGPETFLHR